MVLLYGRAYSVYSATQWDDPAGVTRPASLLSFLTSKQPLLSCVLGG